MLATLLTTLYADESGPVAEAVFLPRVVERDLQLPKVPWNIDKNQRDWMESVTKALNKGLLSKGGGKFLTVNDLVNAGVIGQLPSGTVTAPPANVTIPPKVTGLTATGAMTTIILNWNAPSFANFGMVEIWRSDSDDIGQAFRVGTSVTNFYQDAVGTGASKYYWVRAVSKQGIVGDFNAANGTLGQTSFDPTYVMKLLTSIEWQPLTTYLPFQYVRPIPAHPDATPFAYQNFQFVCIDGGTSAATEPAWPTTVGATINDGDATWQCRPLTEKVPFTVGDVDGVPSVAMNKAYIQDAAINNAQIKNLSADKITAGQLKVGNDIQVGNKIWNGFYDFDNAAHVAGFWLGLDGGLPRFKLETGLIFDGVSGYFQRSFYFDGETIRLENTDVVSGADGQFDDLAMDSGTGNRGYFTELGFAGLFAASDYIQLDAKGRPIISGDIVDPANYYCWIFGSQKTQTNTSPLVSMGNGNSNYNGRPGMRYQGGVNYQIVPYDYPDATTKYRMKKKAISFKIKLSDFGLYPNVGHQLAVSLLNVYILAEGEGFPSDYEARNTGEIETGYTGAYLAKAVLSYLGGDTSVDFKNSSGQTLFSADVSISQTTTAPNPTPPPNFITTYGAKVLIHCQSDNETLEYMGNRRLRVGVEYNNGPYVGDNDDNDVYGQIKIDFQLIDIGLELNADSSPDLTI